MPKVKIRGYDVEVNIIDFDKGCPAYKTGHPDNWTPAEPPYIEFEFAEENELLNQLLDECCAEEAERELLK